MPDMSGFLTALGQSFGGYAIDQKRRDDMDEKEAALAEKQRAAQAALAERTQTAQTAAQDREAGLYLKGIRPGTAPTAVPGALAMASQFAGGAAPIGVSQAQQADPEQYAPDRFRQMTPGQYVDTQMTPEAITARRDEQKGALEATRAARLEASRQAAETQREIFRQKMQDRRDAMTNGREQWVAAGVDKDTGQPLIMNSRTGETKVGGGMKAGAMGGMPQDKKFRVLSAVSEARLADERMRAFEDKLLSGKQDIGVLSQAGGNLMTNLVGSHSLVGALGQAGSEAALNVTNPEYTQYLRDAMTIGRAEQMISPRGGNETMVRANSLLARAGTGANKATIDASRMARQALFGQAGGIEQTLSPAESQKLTEGVRRIKAGEHGAAPGTAVPATTTPPHDPGGNVNLGATITPNERAALKAAGFTEPQITAKYGPP